MFTLSKLENGLTVTFSAAFEGIDRVCEETKQFMSENGFGNLHFDVILGVREALTNAVRHGSKMDANKTIFFSIIADPKLLRILVTDSGSGFDWRAAERKTVCDTAPHGRGIGIIKQYFDTIHFNEVGNTVELIKSLK